MDDDEVTLASTESAAVPTAGGDSASADASSAAFALQKNKKKDKEEKEKAPVRQSRRDACEAAPDAELVKAKARRKASSSETQGSAEATHGVGLVAAAAAKGAEEAASAGAQHDGDDDDDTTPSRRVSLRPDLKTAAGHKNRENQEHESGVWREKSPTGIGLGEEFCKLAFDHTDGKASGRQQFPTRPQGRFPNSRARALTTRASGTSRVATSAIRGRSPSSRTSHRSAATSTTPTRTSACSRRSTSSTRTVSRARFSRRSTSSGSIRRTTRA